MVKRIFNILILLLALAFSAWVVYYIDAKQNNQYHFNSFQNEDQNKAFYIPDMNRFKNIQLNEQIGNKIQMNEQVQKMYSSIHQKTEWDFNKDISKEVFISFSDHSFTLVIKNFYFSASDIKRILNQEFNQNVQLSEQQFTIDNTPYFFQSYNDYFVISTQPITPHETPFIDYPNVNYDFATQLESNTDFHFYKSTPNRWIEYQIDSIQLLNGQAVSPFHLLKICPADFEKIEFYGSSRFQKDYHTLTQLNDSNNTFNWVRKSYIHVYQGSNHLIIGEQNEGESLSSILDEETIALSPDSLLPQPFYKNNFELHFFYSNKKWNQIVPHSPEVYSVYTEYNNYNIIANSTEAMDWFIKSIQLGNNCQFEGNNSLIPFKTNRLIIQQNKDQITVEALNYINEKKSLALKNQGVKNTVESLESMQLAYQIKMPLIKTDGLELQWLDNGSENGILVSNKNQIAWLSVENEEEIWDKTYETELIKTPQSFEWNQQLYTFVCTVSKIDVLNDKGQSVSGFPYPLPFGVNDAIVVKYPDGSDPRILVCSKNQLINLDLQAQAVSGWNFNPSNNPLKKVSYQHVSGKDYFLCTDSQNQMYFTNRRGEAVQPNLYPIQKVKGITSNGISGTPTRQNLSLLVYKDQYILSQYLTLDLIDTIKLNQSFNPTDAIWRTESGTQQLVIEEYDKIHIFNSFGILNSEIHKPQANLKYIQPNGNNNNIYIFKNIQTNELYLLDSFGRTINETPIKSDAKIALNADYIAVYFDFNVWIYKLQ